MKENVIYDVEFVDLGTKRGFKEKFKERVSDVKDWIVDHKEIVIPLVPAIIGGITTTVKVVGRRANLNKEKSLKDLYCYDNSLGHYWALRRKLSNKEWLEIDRRKKNGERLADILAELKVLK